MTSPCCAVQAWSTCWDPKYEILFSDDWADAFYHANINYLDATCVQFTELCVCVLWLSACSRLMLSRSVPRHDHSSHCIPLVSFVLCCVVLASVHAFRCRNGEGLYGLDRMPCRFYETTSLFANLLYSSP